MFCDSTVAVVVPAFNEATLLPRTLSRVPAFVDRIVVVDDASRDGTAEVVQGLGDPRLVLVQHDKNRGVGAAIASGYAWALSNRIDVTVVIGADDQMHPDDMPALVQPIVDRVADYVVGDRLAWPQGWKKFPLQRLLGVVSLGAMTRVVTGYPVNDAQCGYTAISLSALKALPLGALYSRYGFPNDMLAKAAISGLRVKTTPVRPIYADEVSKLRIPAVIGPILELQVRNFVQVRRQRSGRAPQVWARS